MTVDYQRLLEETLLELVRKILRQVEQEGLQGNQHFYISFRTDAPHVALSSRMRSRYPKEITIVLQYQFHDLLVNDQGFSVYLAFDGIKEKVVVPFRALTAFADPSVNFSLQFNPQIAEAGEVLTWGGEEKLPERQPESVESNKRKRQQSNVVVLDKFRNKKKLS